MLNPLRKHDVYVHKWTRPCVWELGVFVNVAYPHPFIIVGHIHVWHLPLTSALRQAQLLKGQILRLMSITSTLSLLSSLLCYHLFFYTRPIGWEVQKGVWNLTWHVTNKLKNTFFITSHSSFYKIFFKEPQLFIYHLINVTMWCSFSRLYVREQEKSPTLVL